MGKEPHTSANPPVLIKGTASDARNKMFFILSSFLNITCFSVIPKLLIIPHKLLIFAFSGTSKQRVSLLHYFFKTVALLPLITCSSFYTLEALVFFALDFAFSSLAFSREASEISSPPRSLASSSMDSFSVKGCILVWVTPSSTVFSMRK